MIRTVLYLQPRQDADLEAFFAQEGVLDRAVSVPGCLGASLHRPVTPGDPYLVTATWTSEADYQGWVDDPWRQQATGALGALLETGPRADEGGQLYTVVAAAGEGTWVH